jgi:hypothetical protein
MRGCYIGAASYGPVGHSPCKRTLAHGEFVLSCGISDVSKERKAMSARIKDALFRLLKFDPPPGRDLPATIDVPVLLQCSESAAHPAVTPKEAPADASMQLSMAPARIKPASDNEVVWEMLKEQVQLTAREGNLARCRNVHLAMANHLLRRNKPTRALQALCVVCIFDLCGARNRDDAPAEMRKTYSRYDATGAALAPWLVRRVSHLSRDMALSMEQIRDIFLGVSTRLKIPKDSRKLWAVLQLALEGGLDSDDEVRRGRHIRQILE